MLKFNSAKDKAVLETIKAIQSERAAKSRYTVTETLKSGLDLSGQFQTGQLGGKFVQIETGAERPVNVFLSNGTPDNKDSYDLVIATANADFEYQGIKYLKGDRKLMLV